MRLEIKERRNDTPFAWWIEEYDPDEIPEILEGCDIEWIAVNGETIYED